MTWLAYRSDTPGPKLSVEHASSPQRSFPEAVGRGIVPQNPRRMSLLWDESDSSFCNNIHKSDQMKQPKMRSIFELKAFYCLTKNSCMASDNHGVSGRESFHKLR